MDENDKQVLVKQMLKDDEETTYTKCDVNETGSREEDDDGKEDE